MFAPPTTIYTHAPGLTISCKMKVRVHKSAANIRKRNFKETFFFLNHLNFFVYLYRSTKTHLLYKKNRNQ